MLERDILNEDVVYSIEIGNSEQQCINFLRDLAIELFNITKVRSFFIC